MTIFRRVRGSGEVSALICKDSVIVVGRSACGTKTVSANPHSLKSVKSQSMKSSEG